MKKIIITALLSGATSLPALAANSDELADANQVFDIGSGQTVELAMLSPHEMKTTEGAVLPVLVIAGGGAVSSWLYHANHYRNHGTLGSSSGAAWAAGSGMIGGLHGGGLAVKTGLSGIQKAYVTARGTGVSATLNKINPWH